ncbi:hypothetical protein [Endozoicomonas sp. ALB091]|uniref:hypothetical protein n=1 Tax=Endozoicomonas sp. ALB091 TaxID=3403073 RepID=UPI003BB7FEE5
MLNLGSVVTLGVDLHHAPAGAKGVVVEVYNRHEMADNTGWFILFDNGFADGFSAFDLEHLKVHDTGEVDQVIRRYRFTNVSRLHQEYLDGWFDLALGKR